MKTKFFLICIFLFATSLTKAQAPGILSTAIEKEKEGLFSEASILYERMLFSQDNQNEIAITGKIRCLKKENKYTEVTRFIKQNYSLVTNDSIRYKLY